MRKTLITAVFVLAFAAAAAAQVGRVGGTVKDDTGNPIKGATVMAENSGSSPNSFTATTDDKGRFSIIGLRAGRWVFTASAPGFVFYYTGPLSTDRSCLSFCMWTSRAEARAAAGRPDHVTAVSVLDEMYERYTLEFVRVTGLPGMPLQFEPYDRPVIDPSEPKAA